jgi:exodeoxyribonuclease-5
MNITLSQGQADALEMIGRFLNQEESRVAVITGYAGTGKTTLIKVIEESYGTPIVITPTGKAALRVTEATGLSACTIHRLIYKAEDDPKTGDPIFVLKSVWDFDGSFVESLVLVDEASMVDGKVWADLISVARSMRFRILLMGDRFQLPPVSKSEDGKAFSALDVETKFSVNLTEVIRQAQDSPIIRASMILRSGKPDFEAMKLLTPVGASKLTDNAIRLNQSGAGAVLVHRNATRHRLNTEVRQKLGLDEGAICPGEPLLVLQNNYGLERYNGELVRFEGWDVRPSESTTEVVRDPYKNSALTMSFGMGLVDGASCMLSPEEVTGRSEKAEVGNWIIKKTSKKIFKDRIAYEEDERVPPHLHANYGYALTVHKSQGSEWNEVLIVMESSLAAMNEIERKRFLYTAVTRGKKQVSFVYLK